MTTLILLDSKPNRHSLNALVGALETATDLDDLELRLPSGEAQLEQHLAQASSAGKRPIVGLSFTTPQLWRVGQMMALLRDAAHADTNKRFSTERFEDEIEKVQRFARERAGFVAREARSAITFTIGKVTGVVAGIFSAAINRNDVETVCAMIM